LSDARRHELSLHAAKDEAQREGSYAQPSYGARRYPRPFQTLVTAQLEKNRKDRFYSDRLNKERKQGQQRFDRRQHDINPSKQGGLSSKHQRGKKSMSSMLSVESDGRPYKKTVGDGFCKLQQVQNSRHGFRRF
jgi:hypothetical protein